VPKIPSTTILDLARAIAPGVETQNIGIRAGEKLHEVLVSEDEARLTLELGDRYVIQPSHPWWTAETWADGRTLADGFRYASDSNSEWLDVEGIRRIIGGLA